MNNAALSSTSRDALGQANGKSQELYIAVVPKKLLETKGKHLTLPIYWLENIDSYNDAQANQKLLSSLKEILTDELTEDLWCLQKDTQEKWIAQWSSLNFCYWAEKQFLPGVTDNLAHTVEEALGLKGCPNIKVASGLGFLFSAELFSSAQEIEEHSRYKFYHPLTDKFIVHDLKGEAKSFLTFPEVHLPNPKPTEAISLDLSDNELVALSKNRLLSLTLEEMQAIHAHFQSNTVKDSRQSKQMPQSPTDVELEVIAQTWSEHCKHKIFNATIYHNDQTDQTKSTKIESLYKTYIKGATEKIKPSRNDLISVFEDNAGVVRLNESWAYCFKVETHNSPSALEPYGGALTGILGVNRDILGTGLGAKPIFNTDVFCFAYPSDSLPQRPKLLPAETILNGVRKGVEDGGNKSGIPTINGAIYFHPGYRAKPLVFCGTGGILPLQVKGVDACFKHTKAGDKIVMAGGRVGKDGVHGATFSSEALHEGSPVSAVQIGDPFTQKRLLDFVLEARDLGLITGITDNGAGGLSSSVGEMSQITGGATIELDSIPLKYSGLADWEIVISESQERMTISTNQVDELKKLAQKHNVEVTEIGTFNTNGYFEVTRLGKPVALIDLNFLHNGLPKMRLESVWNPPKLTNTIGAPPRELAQTLISLLAHPNISSREVVIRQYDHEVQGTSTVKPLMGPTQQAPCDAAVQKPLYEESLGLVVSCGICPQLSQIDTYLMAICAVDEAVRNAICAGANPFTISILDNFCWPDPVTSAQNPDGKYKLAQLVRANQGLYDAAVAYNVPLISGKDSMKNDFDDGTIRLSIPPTLLVSAIGKIDQAENAVTMEFKKPGDIIYLLSAGTPGLASSHYAEVLNWTSDLLPELDLNQAILMYRKLHQAIGNKWVHSCHDLSEGGLAVALAECVIGSRLGVKLEAEKIISTIANLESKSTPEVLLHKRMDIALFAEGPGRILVTIDPAIKQEWESFWQGFNMVKLGTTEQLGRLRIISSVGKPVLDMTADGLNFAWSTKLPFSEVEK